MRYIIALDQGTTSSRSLLFGQKFRTLAQYQREHPQHYPHPGWVEHDAGAIWSSQSGTLKELVQTKRLKSSDIAAIGITNQRETVIAWDRKTGKVLGPAIVWQCRRTSDFCEKLKRDGLEPELRAKTGLVADAYFSASKMRWLLRNVDAVKQAAKAGRLCLGTVDSWLIYNLTGGERFATDATNASRTQLMDLATRHWDPDLLRLFGVPRECLADILPCDGDFGETKLPFLKGVPIRGVAGDQQASLFGHRRFRTGEMKNTYGTGCFLLQNVGARPKTPHPGLLGSVAWSLTGGRTAYCHEGAVMVAGAALQFLRDGIGVLNDVKDSEAMARSLADNEGVFFVPAFVGLGTPYWDSSARGLLIGLTRGTTPAHLCRAALEAIAFQSADLARCFGPGKGGLRVDGGASRNSFLMQFQADILGREVRADAGAEVTALGAAMLAALGCGMVHDLAQLEQLKFPEKVYAPTFGAAKRKALMGKWSQAVERSRGWYRG